MIRKNFALIFSFCILAFGQDIFAQSQNENVSMQKAKLIQSGPYETSELASLYIDMLRQAMGKSPNSRGVFVFYCGKFCKYGEVEAHTKGLVFSLKGKGWKTFEYAIVQGGYRDKFALEYWMVPENVGIPIPDSTVNIEDVKFRGNYKRTFVPYDCCD